MGIYYAYDSPEMWVSLMAERPATADAVRSSIRAWLRDSLPREWPACGHGPWVERWRRAFYGEGWAVPTWPAELGGRGLDERASRIINEELAAVDAPVPYNLVTVRMVGAT